MKIKSLLKAKKNRGQALIPVLIVLVIVITLGVGILHLSIGGMLLSSQLQEGEAVLMATEGALENGLMRFLRNPSYSSESLQVAGVPCTINVSGQAPTIMTAECKSDRSLRRLEAEINFVQGEMVVDNIREIE